jgi:hypothetical protein
MRPFAIRPHDDMCYQQHDPGVAWRIWDWAIRDNGVFMGAETQTPYLEYMISVTEADGRFTPRVTRPGGLIEHDGHVSEVWAAASCFSLERAIQTAKAAIDGDRIR